ncbi:MAG: hypothetical protein HY067_15130 [Betaproteobacteria bacterium]|nr:hypothetical protein [Betaproteobacteria bacterium]
MAAESLEEQAQHLADAVLIFKLSQASASWDGRTERRGPDRPHNVERMPVKAVAPKAPEHKVLAKPAGRKPAAEAKEQGKKPVEKGTVHVRIFNT